jgi:hypothetical protein
MDKDKKILIIVDLILLLFDFVLQVGDEIRFQGTETQTYTITSVDNAISTPGGYSYIDM